MDNVGLARAILAADAQQALPLLRAAGFGDLDQANKALDRLSGPTEDLTPLPAELLAAVLSCGWPDRGLRHLERFVEVTGARSTLYARLEQAPPVRDGLVRILAHSRFLTDVLVRSPEHLYWLFESTPHLTQPMEAAELRAQLRQSLGGLDEDAQPEELRRFQRRELLRIGTAEVLGCKDVDQVGRELADLADVTVAAALDNATQALRARHGRPSNERGRPALFSVVGLGKYGGRELNFSSDIDLLFVYDEDGLVRQGDSRRATGAQGSDGRGRQVRGIENALFFDRLAERLIQTLTEVTAEGFLYRVDMRLRPEGDRGPLTRSLRSHWIYYETRGELWERQMLIKARRAAGSTRLWRRFRDMLVPFVYPTHFAEPPRDEIRRIKERIEAEIRRRPGKGNNIKLQPGGIRDIEFVVQCLQLLRGRQSMGSRSIGTLQSMARLQQAGALSEDEAQALSSAYRFLRRVENLLQIESGRPSYAIPDDGSPQARALGCLLGLGDTRLSTAVAAHLRAVRGVYEDLFYGDGPQVSVPAAAAGVLLEAHDGADAAVRQLTDLGFRDPVASHRVVRQLGANPMLTSTGRGHLHALLGELLPLLAATPDPDDGVVRFARIIDAYGAPGAFYGMGLGHPRFLAMLATICGTSSLLADLIQHDPGLLDGLVGLDPSGGMPRLEGRPRQDAAGLRRFRNGVLLRIGADDLLGLASTEETFHRMSDLADEIVAAIVGDVLGSLGRRRGRPRLGRRRTRTAGFACLAGGKAGGRELDFASDLDLFFIYEGEGRTGRGVDNAEFFSEAAREVIQRLGAGLFEVDARLRPEGRSAPVAISLAGYRKYLRTRGATWERLALSRVRQVAGDPGLGRRVLSAIDGFVYGQPLVVSTVDEIVAMRRRMEPRPERDRMPVIDIKRGAGGIVDAEFIAQILALHRGRSRRQVRHTSTRVVLERMVEDGALSRGEGRSLLLAYERLRQLQKALRLSSERSAHLLPTDDTERTILARSVGLEDGQALTAEVEELMARTRRIYDTVIGRVRDEAAG